MNFNAWVIARHECISNNFLVYQIERETEWIACLPAETGSEDGRLNGNDKCIRMRPTGYHCMIRNKDYLMARK